MWHKNTLPVFIPLLWAQFFSWKSAQATETQLHTIVHRKWGKVRERQISARICHPVQRRIFLYDKGRLLKYSFLWRFSSLPQTTSEKIRKHWSVTQWGSRGLAAGASHTAAHLPAGWAPLVLPAPTAHRHHPILLPPGFAGKARSEFSNPLKKNNLNGSVLKYSKCLGYFFLTSFSLLALESYLPECKYSLFFSSSLGTSILEGLKYLHFVQFWHRCSEIHFIHQMKFILV